MQTSTLFDFDNAFQFQLRQGIALTCRTFPALSDIG
jgi:hypothetical protein